MNRDSRKQGHFVEGAACATGAVQNQPATRPGSRSTTSGRILILEPAEQSRNRMAQILIAAGYECQTADSVRNALALLNSGEHFDLVLCGFPESDRTSFSSRVSGRPYAADGPGSDLRTN